MFVARALAQEPRLLLLDEPTSNLDINHQARFFHIIRGLVDDGITAGAAIHDLSLAARFCDRLGLLNKGSLMMCLPPKTSRSLLGCGPSCLQIRRAACLAYPLWRRVRAEIVSALGHASMLFAVAGLALD